MNPVLFPRAVILCNKHRKRVPEILHRQIGKGIDLHCRGKSSHDRRAKAVHQPLYRQDSQIHDGLLQTGKGRKSGNLPDPLFSETDSLLFSYQFRETNPRIDGNADPRHILGYHRGSGRSSHAPFQTGYKPQIQTDIQAGGHRQENQRHNGIPPRAQKRCKKVI